MKPADPSLRAHSMPSTVWAGFAVLVAGLALCVAMLSGLGQAMSCGTFGMNCIGWAFAAAFVVLCVAGALLVHGVGAMPAGVRAIKVLVMCIAAMVVLAAMLMAGFAALVLMR